MHWNFLMSSMADPLSAEAEDFYASVGRLTVSWAHVEFGLDWLVHLVHTQLDGPSIVEPDKPLSLERKIKYLRKAFSRIPALSAFNERFDALASEVQSVSQERHDLIQGFIAMSAEQEGQLRTGRGRPIPGESAPQTYVATSLTAIRAAARAYNIGMLAFAREVESKIGN